MSILTYDQLPATVPQCKVTNLTAANLLNLRATPIEVAPAPGAGFMIVPVFVTLTIQVGATPYDVSGGGDITLLWGADTSFATVTAQKEILTSAVDSGTPFDVSAMYMSSAAWSAPLSVFENAALKIKNPGAGEYVDGDGSAKLTVHYLVRPV